MFHVRTAAGFWLMRCRQVWVRLANSGHMNTSTCQQHLIWLALPRRCKSAVTTTRYGLVAYSFNKILTN